MNIKQIETKIRRAVKRAQKNGIKIVAGDFGVYIKQNRFINNKRNCVCPLGAVLIGKTVKDSFDDLCPNSCAEGQILGKSKNWVASFVDGFDRCSHMYRASYTIKSAHNLGKKFRKEILGL